MPVANARADGVPAQSAEVNETLDGRCIKSPAHYSTRLTARPSKVPGHMHLRASTYSFRAPGTMILSKIVFDGYGATEVSRIDWPSRYLPNGCLAAKIAGTFTGSVTYVLA